MDVVTTITTIHVIKGKPSQSADLMLSRARQAGHRVRVRAERDHAVVSIWRNDDADYETRIEWTLDDARQAQLYPGKPDSNWAKYTRSMLRARAIAECVRAACPEVLHGAIYTPEELGAVVNEEGLPVDAPVQPLRVIEHEVVKQSQIAAEGRDYLHEAREASDADAVRRIWLDARADGAIPEYLQQIAAVGREKTTTAAPQSDALIAADTAAARDELYRAARDAGLSAEEVGARFHAAYGCPTVYGTAEQLRAATATVQASDVHDAETVPDSEDDHAAAVAELREAADAAHLEDFDDGAATALGMPIEKATPDAIRALAAQIRPAA
ncbi:recombinase RecT [Streptomyces sp. NPDC001404]|uniref:recombinase RecT n=1 Tax=Streptomyces sp. NPDC001404 TaxID=3364571 RepID=UPI00368F9F8C